MMNLLMHGPKYAASPSLGAVPTDEELSYVYGYTPVTSGWIPTTQGAYYPAPYIPPGWRADGQKTPSISLGEPISTASKAEADAVVAALNAHNQRIFKVTIISTLIVGTSAAISAWRTWKQLQREEAREAARRNK